MVLWGLTVAEEIPLRRLWTVMAAVAVVLALTAGSAFANPLNMQAKEAATLAAYAECLRLEMTHEHGL